MSAQWIKANGEKITIEPKNGTDFKLDELQAFVGGFIEIVNMYGHIMVVDEEGLLKHKPYNLVASVMSGRPLVGDVVFCTPEMVK